MATIYCIVPLPVLVCDVGDIYVGSTICKLSRRFSYHRKDFKRFCNGLQTNCSAYRLFEKYGVENCTIIEIEKCWFENRKEREAFWIKTHNSININKLNFNANDWFMNHRKEKAEYDKIYRRSKKHQIAAH